MNATATVEFIRDDNWNYTAQTEAGEFYLTRDGRDWTVERDGEPWGTFISRVVAQDAVVELVATVVVDTATEAADDAPKVWEFATTREAYDASQCNDAIEDGAVLVVESEKVVGILFQAWPAAITTAYGQFHGYLTAEEFAALDEERPEPLYAPAYAVALQEAEKRGYTIPTVPMFPPGEPGAEDESIDPDVAPVVEEVIVSAAELGTAPELVPATDGGLFGFALTEGTPETGFGFTATAPAEALALF
ncbi:Hypothetical protein AJAP_42810 (plasmid) [Amycolatopsis japonica]|uniref:Uncharacterized protein n=1 Tax=Amycolatopsis japonica TaxID=208439 RepID=A0A075V9X7_9PSEU|nr:hypothetical protein [Amycolatopsis japonica]AIG81329.1 Hypothetical protein AJAP_42810 [Amycolatopsis japonica]